MRKKYWFCEKEFKMEVGGSENQIYSGKEKISGCFRLLSFDRQVPKISTE